MKQFSKLIGLGIAVVILVVVAAPATAQEPIQAPEDNACRTTVLQRFETGLVQPPFDGPRSRHTLLWSVTNESTVELREGNDGEWETVEPVGLRIVQPIRDTRYWIRATNSEDWAFESSVLMDITESPIVLVHEQSSRHISAGEEVTLSWETLYVDYVVMVELPGVDQWKAHTHEELTLIRPRLDASGSKTVSPTRTTTYLFYAVGTSDGRPYTAGWNHTVHVTP